MTVLGLILIGLLAWMLWWWIFLPEVHFASLPIVDYDLLAVPPPQFVAEDVEAFSRLPRRGRAAVLGDLQTSQGIATLTNRLQGLGAKPRDTLIFYLRIYGVSNDGKAWVLCSDYLRTAQGGRYAVAELLDQISRSPAGKKLLVLDAGPLACDPRLGMIVNEFPQLLDEELRRVNDPALWVLLSNRPLEISHVSQSAKRSAFGHFVVEGLMGAADRDGDGMVELAELVDFVRGGVSDWVHQDSGGAETQTPWLLHGGEGAADAPTGLALLPISDHGREAGDVLEEEQAPGDKKKQSPAETVGKLLDEAWRLRDRVQQRGPLNPWTPLDYAPHLWRAYQQLLLSYERRSRGGMEYDPQKLADNLRTNILPLASLAAGQPLPPAVGKATIINRLADARQRFLAKFKAEWFDRLVEDQQAARYLELVRLKNELVFRAVDYVRWYDAAARSSPRRHRLCRPISDFLTELRLFIDRLDALEQVAADPSKSSRVEAEKTLGGLDLQAQTLERLRRAIEEEGLYKDAAELIDAVAENPAKKGIAGPIDGLLATPLLPAPLRASLLRAWAAVEQPFTTDSTSVNGAPPIPSLVRCSDQLHQQAAFEGQLVALADPATRLPTVQPSEAAAVEALPARYQEFGKVVGEFYSGLPRRINQNFQPGDLAAAQRRERLLRAVDARDAEDIRDDVAAVRPVRFPPSAPSGRETPPTVKVRIPARPPAPDVVDLLVYQIDGTAERRIEGEDSFRLRPFPNRVNGYRFALVNRSGRARNVLVQWLPAPPRPLSLWEKVRVRVVGAPIIPELEIKLPATEDPVPIGFPEPDTKKPTEGEKETKQPETAPAARPLPTAGLTCVIRDPSNDQSKWIKRLDFAARPPREYVTPRVRYDARAGKIRIDVQPAAAGALPPLSPETPITVVWNTEGELGPQVAVKSEAVITAADQTALLYAEVDPGADKKVWVRLTVDGYPRAFLYEVRCDRDRPDIRPDRDRRYVHFTAPSPDQAFRVPLSAPIVAALEVDAPEDAFRGSGDAVEVRIIAADGNRELCPEERRQFFSDRQTTIHLDQLTARGEMKIRCLVGDFKIPMTFAGLKNTKVRLAAELLLAGRTAARDFVPLVLDGAPPVFKIQAPGRPVPRGQNATVSAQVTDELSGVGKMEFGFEGEKSGEFSKKIEPIVVQQPSTDGVWRAALPTKDLEPGQYRILVRATDRVGCAANRRSFITIGPPASETAPAAAKTSTIRGRVALQDGRPLPNIRVTLRGTSLATVTDANGRFTFRDVPHGKYTIDAKGTGLGRELSGSKELELPTATEPAVVELRLEW